MHKFIEKHWLPLLALGAALLVCAPPKADAKGLTGADRDAYEKRHMPIMCDSYEAGSSSVERCYDYETNLVCYSIGGRGTSCNPNNASGVLRALYEKRKEKGELQSIYSDDRGNDE